SPPVRPTTGGTRRTACRGINPGAFMSLKGTAARLLAAGGVSLFDLVAAALLFAGGLAYHWEGDYWAIGLVGETQYGDGQFWWTGALHVSEGVFADNPGRGFRPGYFLLTGLTLPVLGTHFLTYHKYFLAVFLAAAVFFYLALRRPL